MSHSRAPIVSVVLPFFNAERALERAVLSILNQTYSSLELILVNNNSSDKSLSIAQQLAETDLRIVLVAEIQIGVSYAANKGNALAKGKYIARMDADDFSHPTRIEKQVQLLNEKPEIGVASCLVNHVGHHENTRGLSKFVDWANELILPIQIELNRFIEAPFINPTVMFRKELLKEHGEFIHGDFPEDYELWLRWISKGVKIQKVPEILFDWYDSDTRLTRTDNRYSIDAFYRTKTQYLSKWLTETKNATIWVWGAGRVSRKRASFLAEMGISIQGYIDVKSRSFEDNQCINFKEFNWESKTFVLSYVANWGAREKIREFLISKGKVEGIDFILVA
jgi:glycosyltransferase involved in cell wall biosynthesis